ASVQPTSISISLIGRTLPTPRTTKRPGQRSVISRAWRGAHASFGQASGTHRSGEETGDADSDRPNRRWDRHAHEALPRTPWMSATPFGGTRDAPEATRSALRIPDDPQ